MKILKHISVAMSTQKACLFGMSGIALVLYSVFIFRTAFNIEGEVYFTLVDDAMISMRYGKHLAEGYGLVWNIGEAPVQGFTNLGWTLYMAVIHLLPIPLSKTSLLVMVTSVGILIATAFVLYRLVKLLEPKREMGAIIAATIVLFYFPFVYWSLRGMEVGVATLLVYLGVVLAVSLTRNASFLKSLFVGLVLFAAVLVRIDVVLSVGLVLLYLLSFKQLRASLAAPVFLIPSFGLACILWFQVEYFGAVFPNTYYLKMEGVSIYERVALGAKVFVEYASRDSIALLLVVLVGLRAYKSIRTREVFLLLGIFVIQCMYSIYSGGDYAEPLSAPQVDAANRFVTQGMPALIVLFSIVIDSLVTELSVSRGHVLQSHSLSASVSAIAIAVGAILIMSAEPWVRWTYGNAPLLRDDIWRARLGVHINRFTSDDTVIAAHAAGNIPYFSRRNTVDLLGKSDRVVANTLPKGNFRPGHNKWDYEYSIGRIKPDIVADKWGDSVSYLSKRRDYSLLPNGMYVRVDSDVPALDQLSGGYR